MKIKIYILVIVCSVLIGDAYAQVRNYATLGVDAGYAALLDNEKAAYPMGGAASSLSFGYEMQYKRRLLFNVGVSARYAYTMSGVGEQTLPLRMRDTEGEEFNYNCFFFDGRNRLNSLYVNIPVMIGCQTSKMYFLVGGRLLLDVWSAAKVSTHLTTTASYDRYIGVLEGMEEHQIYTDRYIEVQPASPRFAPQLNVCAEIGWRLEHSIENVTGFDVEQKKILYRLGIFAEYGVLDQNRHNAQEPRLSFYDDGKGLEYNLNHVYNSVDTKNLHLSNLLVGLRFTVLFQIPERKDCVLCRDEYSSARHSSGGGRIDK